MRLLRILGSTLFAAALLAGCASAPPADPGYKPRLRQPGKDVMWLPTPPELVEKMMAMAQVTPKDRVYDLGSGDGVIPIIAAQKFGVQAVGIEYNPQLAEHARRKVAEAGVADKVRIITGDIFKEDFSSATVVTLYLLPELNLQLRPILLDMPPGTRVVAHAFDMSDWQPDDTASHGDAQAFLWIVPAKAEGRWQLRGADFEAVLDLQQGYQNLGGSITVRGQAATLLGARLRGDALSFRWRQDPQYVGGFQGRVVGNRLEGTVEVFGHPIPVQGTRR